MSYTGPDRRKEFTTQELKIITEIAKRASDEAVSKMPVDDIAERAADKVVNDLYKTIGKSVVTKITLLVGIIAASIVAWLASKGVLPK